MTNEFNPLNAEYNDGEPTLDELITFLLSPPLDDPNYLKEMREYRKELYPDMTDEDFEFDPNDINNIYQEFEFTVNHTNNTIVSYKHLQALFDTKKEDRPEELDMMANVALPEKFQNSLNAFGEILGPDWGEKLEYVLRGGPGTILSLMDGYVWEATFEGSKLTEEQKQLVKDLREATAEAFCVNGPSMRLMKVLDNTSLEYIYRIYNNPVRLERAINNIDFVIRKLKIYRLMAQYIPVFFTGFCMSYKWKYVHNYLANKIVIKPFSGTPKENKKHRRKDEKLQKTKKIHSVGIILGILLSKYAQTIEAKDYASQWFVVMFLKFLSVNSFVSERTKGFDDTLLTGAKNFFEYVDLVVEKYFIVGEVPEELKKVNTVPEADEIDTTVPTKEQWEDMKKTPEEWEKESHEKMLQIQQEVEQKKLEAETNSDTTILPAEDDLVHLGVEGSDDKITIVEDWLR